MGKEHDYSKYLSKIKCPVLIIHGENDIIPVSSSEQYLDYIPKSEMSKIKNGTNFLFNEEKNEFNEILKKFLEKL